MLRVVCVHQLQSLQWFSSRNKNLLYVSFSLQLSILTVKTFQNSSIFCLLKSIALFLVAPFNLQQALRKVFIIYPNRKKKNHHNILFKKCVSLKPKL